MIKVPTVLVLGAGSNNEIGFPTGSELKDKIIENLTNPPPEHGWFPTLAELGFKNPNEISERIRFLETCDLDNIDLCINRKPKYSPFYKACIALALIPCENPKKLENFDNRKWYRFLYNALFEDVGTPQGLMDNKLSILTFNYDRSLEQYLWNKFKTNFSDEDPSSFFNHLDIIHIYGQLGVLSGQGSDSRSYSTHLDIFSVSSAIKSIYTVDEMVRRYPKIIHSINNKFAYAERIYFLGFGYDEFNLKMIDFDKELASKSKGTSYKIRTLRRQNIIQKWKGLELASPDTEIIDFFQDKFPLD